MNFDYIPNKENSISTKHPFFILEGIDGSGKSSLGPIVAKECDFSFYEHPIAFKEGIDSIDKYATNKARLLFYLGYNLQVSHDLINLCRTNSALCVRYVYSTIVYHVVKGVDIKYILSLIERIDLAFPKKVVFLDVSDKEVQMRRLENRGKTNEDKRIIKSMDKIRSIYLSLSEYMPNYFYIDTSYLTKEQVINTLINHFKDHDKITG